MPLPYSCRQVFEGDHYALIYGGLGDADGVLYGLAVCWRPWVL